MGITEKMKGVLRKNGYSDEVIAKMTYEDASPIIGKIMEKIADKKNKPLEVEAPKPVHIPVETHKPFNGQTAMYVSYAKDLCIALMEKGDVEGDDAMQYAIALIKLAKQEMEK